MTGDGRKGRERSIFDLVYAPNNLVEVVSHERPDFLARRNHGLRYFGVEIAEFYFTETDARLHRIPGYSGELLDGKGVRHRDERRNLEVEKIDILDEHDKVVSRGLPAIFRRVPSYAECSRKVAEMISKKHTKLSDAIRDFSHVNLVIRDHSRLLGHLPAREFFRAYFGAALREAVANSCFREVYFVCDLDGRLGIIPLKLLLSMSELFMFGPVYTEFAKTSQMPRALSEFEVFGSYFQGIVATPVLVRKERGSVETIYGDSGLLVNTSRTVTVRRYSDYDFPADALPASSDFSQVAAGFSSRMDEYRKAHTFSTELRFPIATPSLP
jgi:hypothetical protein